MWNLLWDMGSFLRDGKDGVHHALCLGCFEAVSKRHLHGMGTAVRQGHGNVAPHGETLSRNLGGDGQKAVLGIDGVALHFVSLSIDEKGIVGFDLFDSSVFQAGFSCGVFFSVYHRETNLSTEVNQGLKSGL